MDCLFCRIAARQAPGTIVFEDEDIVVFPTIQPQASVHLLLIPRKHLESVADMSENDEPLLGKLIFRAKILAEEQGIAKKGYKIVINTGDNGGQFVDHLHVHLLGGEPVKTVV